MSETVETLVRCWAAWDEKPGNEDRAAALSAALAAVAGPLGVKQGLLTASVQAFRRDGMTAREAIESAVAAFASG